MAETEYLVKSVLVNGVALNVTLSSQGRNPWRSVLYFQDVPFSATSLNGYMYIVNVVTGEARNIGRMCDDWLAIELHECEVLNEGRVSTYFN